MDQVSYLTTYCTNVHPGESVDAVIHTLEHIVPGVKSKVAPDSAFGVGLRLGHEATSELASRPRSLHALKAVLHEQDFNVFTVNGFPYGTFGSGIVKQQVYEPDWRDERRIDYTIQLAQVLTELPGPTIRTISTVAGGFRGESQDPNDLELMAHNLYRTAEALRDIADQSGIQIRLCLEPEPWTSLETTPEVIRFFERYLPPGNPLIDTHLGVCYDCCHQAVQFEDPREAVTQMNDSGIVIGKVQVSSALHLSNPQSDRGRAALLAFAEPRFLHQVVAQLKDGTVLRMLDLDTLAEPPPEWLAADAWRCHFHVPINWEGDERLGTTRGDWEDALKTIDDLQLNPHLEVETYTWHVLPEHLRPTDQDELCAVIADEFRCLRACLAAVR